MKKCGIACLLIFCIFLSGCGRKIKNEGTASAGYTPPQAAESNNIQSGSKIDVSDEGKDKVKTEEGDILVVEDYSDQFSVTTGERTFTVFDLNLCAENGQGSKSYKERFNKLMPLLVEENPDIMTFQEVGKNWMDYLVPMLGPVYDYFLIYPDDSDHTIANPIFYKKEKFEDITGGFFWFSATPEKESAVWSGKGKYGCTWLQLKIKASDLSVHVFNGQLGGTAEDMTQGAGTIYDKCTAISWQRPIVCNVDLGAAKGAESYGKLVPPFTDSNTEGLKTPTSHNYTGKGAVNDFSFFTKATMTADSYTVINEKYDGVYVSDHFPIVTQYTLNKDYIDYGDQFIF